MARNKACSCRETTKRNTAVSPSSTIVLCQNFSKKKTKRQKRSPLNIWSCRNSHTSTRPCDLTDTPVWPHFGCLYSMHQLLNIFHCGYAFFPKTLKLGFDFWQMSHRGRSIHLVEGWPNLLSWVVTHDLRDYTIRQRNIEPAYDQPIIPLS